MCPLSVPLQMPRHEEVKSQRDTVRAKSGHQTVRLYPPQTFFTTTSPTTIITTTSLLVSRIEKVKVGLAVSRNWPDALVINDLQRDTAGTQRGELCPVPRESNGTQRGELCPVPWRLSSTGRTSFGLPKRALEGQ